MNSTYGITPENLMTHLPSALSTDKAMAALAQGAADVLSQRPAEIDKAGIYTRIDQLPEGLLDVLAYDFKIDWYNYDYPVEAKRNLIKTNYYVHRHLGTVGAVRAAVQSVYRNSDVEEWWQDFYNGEPFHFRVMLEAAFPIVPVANTDILRAIYLYKSLRSHLDGVIYRSTANLIVMTNCQWIVYGGRLCGTYPVIARQGSMENHDIVVQTSGGAVGYCQPHAGSITAGTFPGISRYGGIQTDHVIVGTGDGGIVYQVPASGEIISGDYPEIAMVGGLEAGSISASSSGQGVSYSGKLCGDALNFI